MRGRFGAKIICKQAYVFRGSCFCEVEFFCEIIWVLWLVLLRLSGKIMFKAQTEFETKTLGWKKNIGLEEEETSLVVSFKTVKASS